MIDVGTVLQATYRIEDRIGSGGMGEVFRASHLRIPRSYAIKVLRRDIAEVDVAFARFRREAELSSRLGHPNIVEIHDYNRTPEGDAYYVMELLEGEDLKTLIERAAPFALTRVLELLEPVASALVATHQAGVVHRDLKPENIFVSKRGDREIVKVLDFGVSKINGAVDLKTNSNAIVGTPSYMSPEQASGSSKNVDARADQFSLAAIAYEMLSGRRPFGCSVDTPYATLYQIVHHDPLPLFEVPEPVAAAVARALAKQPHERYGDVGAFVDAMARAAGTTTATATATAPAQSRRRSARMTPFILAAVGGLAVGGLGAHRLRAALRARLRAPIVSHRDAVTPVAPPATTTVALPIVISPAAWPEPTVIQRQRRREQSRPGTPQHQELSYPRRDQ